MGRSPGPSAQYALRALLRATRWTPVGHFQLAVSRTQIMIIRVLKTVSVRSPPKTTRSQAPNCPVKLS